VFESVVPDPAEDAVRRVARILRTIAGLIVVWHLIAFILALAWQHLIHPLFLLFNAALAAVMWITAWGVEERKNWARWVGIAVGILELFNFPFGTVVGIAVLVYLARARARKTRATNYSLPITHFS
jgi:cell division protein FtsW (lipid II flippase)